MVGIENIIRIYPEQWLTIMNSGTDGKNEFGQ